LENDSVGDTRRDSSLDWSGTESDHTEGKGSEDWEREHDGRVFNSMLMDESLMKKDV